jgi:hypothetical protein
VNFVQTMKLFSVPALFRTATLTVLGAGAFLAMPAHAGIIYSTNFSTITPSGGALVTGRATELVGAGSLWSQGNYALPAGWTVTNGDVYAYQFTAAPGAEVPLDTTGTEYGLLLNTTCNTSCTGTVGAISYALTGLTVGQAYSVTVDYWGTTAGAGTFNTGANNLGLQIAAGGQTLSSQVTIPNATNGTYQTATLAFTATTTSTTIALKDITNSANNPPAVVVGDVLVQSVPEPSTALFLLVPAAMFFLYRRRVAAKQ